jgi:hypothetical protein
MSVITEADIPQALKKEKSVRMERAAALSVFDVRTATADGVCIQKKFLCEILAYFALICI